MWNDKDITLTNFYGMAKPDPKFMKDRLKKVEKAIKAMGSRYCLAIPVGKKDVA